MLSDLLKRHATKCAEEPPNKRQRKLAVYPSRVIQACESCAQNHLRCEQDKPCSRCQSKNIECRIPSAAQAASTIEANHGLHALAQNESFAESPTPEFYLEEDPGGGLATPRFTPSQDVALEHEGQMMINTSDLFSSGIATPRGLMDFSFSWDIDLTDLDMGFLDRYNQEAPFGVDTPSTEAQGWQETLPQPSSSTENDVSARHEAFKKSIWRYLPQRNRDFGAAEQPNLAFGDAEMQHSRHQSHLNARRVVQERLSGATRDKLLALVLGTCAPTNISRIASAFPTVDLLDGLLQYFFTSPSVDATAWFHLPTFSPSKLRPQLLAAIIAAGAVSTPDIPLRKLGFALHEAARTSIAESFESDNTAIRDLQHLQTLMLNLETGIWSGISRKMEISESFLQPLVTMLRRGGRFRQSTWKSITPDIGEDGLSLDAKWRDWVLQELYLRLVYRVIQHDRQASMAMLKPPLISYAELQLPLPHADSLWRASSAQEWKAAYHNLPGSLMTTMPFSAGCLVDIQPLRCSDSANFVYLYMLWGMVWEYKQMQSVTDRFHSVQTNSLVLPSRHTELTKFFDDFRLSSSSVASQSITILVELMLMYLNSPLEQIQLFAGIEGQGEAYRVCPALEEWVKSSSARTALWHAGQVLRTVKGFSRGLVGNFNAIAVYHVGLIFWGYGCLSRSLDDITEPPSSVYLDSVESIETRRFVTLGRGMPTLMGQGSEVSPVVLSDIGGVMDTLIRVLKANHEGMEGPCPPLVDNLVQLMLGLRTATKKRPA